jgi:hypothetical protein
VGPKAGLCATDKQTYIPLSEVEIRVLDFSERNMITMPNPLLARGTENANIVFTVKALILAFINLFIDFCGLLGNYTASCGNYLPTFRDNVSVPSSRVKIPSTKESQQRNLAA